MSHHLIDPHSGDSLLSSIDGRIKVILLAAALIENISMGGFITPGILLLFALGGLIVGRVKPISILRRMSIPIILAVVAFCSQLIWIEQGETLALINLGFTELSVRSGGVLKGGELAIRILSGMMLLLCFAMTSPLPKLMQAVRWFRVSPILIELTLIMYRYIFLLLEEASRIRTAQRSRLGYVRPKLAINSAATLGGMVLLRSFDRAEQSFAAMRCRGYQGHIHPTIPSSMTGKDWGVAAIGSLALIIPLVVQRVVL